MKNIKDIYENVIGSLEYAYYKVRGKCLEGGMEIKKHLWDISNYQNLVVILNNGKDLEKEVKLIKSNRLVGAISSCEPSRIPTFNFWPIPKLLKDKGIPSIDLSLNNIKRVYIPKRAHIPD